MTAHFLTLPDRFFQCSTFTGIHSLLGFPFKAGHIKGLTVCPELAEGWTVKPIMVRQAHHERLNLRLSRLKWVSHFGVKLQSFIVSTLTLISYFLLNEIRPRNTGSVLVLDSFDFV
jgi:hypothetical protein